MTFHVLDVTYDLDVCQSSRGLIIDLTYMSLCISQSQLTYQWSLTFEVHSDFLCGQRIMYIME